MSLGKSILIAVGATSASFAVVAMAGLWIGRGSSENKSAEATPASAAARTVVIAPVPVDRKGYNLTGAAGGGMVFVSVSLTLARQQDLERACQLMPRLKATVLRDLGPVIWSTPRGKWPAGGADVDDMARSRFDRTLGGGTVVQAKVHFLDNPDLSPEPSCDGRGGWQSWVNRKR